MKNSPKIFPRVKMDFDSRKTYVRPILRWVGGKQRLVASLLKQVPSSSEFTRYLEPFAGAASLFLAGNFQQAVLNDLNPQLIDMYRMLRDQPVNVFTCFQSLLQNYHEDPETMYYSIRDTFNAHIGQQASAEQAARFILLNHTNYNGIYRVNKAGKYNAPHGLCKIRDISLKDVLEVSAKLRCAELINGDYRDILLKAEPGDFIYLDPPYPALSASANFNAYTIDRFTTQQQEELAALARALTREGVKIMISNADLPEIRALYPRGEWSHYQTKMVRSVSRNTPRLRVHELILLNYA